MALLSALDDEYRAWAIYDGVIATFGAVRPFINIQKAEARHMESLVFLLKSYGVAIPENGWTGNVPTFDTLRHGCMAAIQAERDNVALYDRLLSQVDEPEIIVVFESLQRASAENHLPAFERCAK